MSSVAEDGQRLVALRLLEQRGVALHARPGSRTASPGARRRDRWRRCAWLMLTPGVSSNEIDVRRELLEVVDAIARHGPLVAAERRQRHRLAAGDDAEPVERLRALRELGRDLHHDAVLVQRVVDRRHLALAEGVVERVGHVGHADAELPRRRSRSTFSVTCWLVISSSSMPVSSGRSASAVRDPRAPDPQQRRCRRRAACTVLRAAAAARRRSGCPDRRLRNMRAPGSFGSVMPDAVGHFLRRRLALVAAA